MLLQDYDYFLSKENVFFITKGYYHANGKVVALPVYFPSENGEKYHPLFKIKYECIVNEFDKSTYGKIIPQYLFSKENESVIGSIKVPLEDIKQIYEPRKKFAQVIKSIDNGVWKEFFIGLRDICKIPFDDIGIYGSILIDLTSPEAISEGNGDIDTVIYGKNNLNKLKKNFPELLIKLGLKSIDKSVIRRVFERYKNLGICNFSTFEKIINRYWPTIKVSDDISMTIRTVYRPHEIPTSNPFKYEIEDTAEFEGTVIDDSDVSYCPMRFMLDTNKGKYTVASYLFVYQYAVKQGDYVRVKGNLRKGTNFITIDLKDHGINILK